MATNDDEFMPEPTTERDAFPTREQLSDTKRPDPLDFDEPDSSYYDVISSSPKSGAPDSAEVVDESDAGVLRELASKAKTLGMHDDEISQLKDTGALRSVIAALQRQASVETAEDEQSRRKPDAGANPSSEYEALAALDEDDAIDPSAIKAIKALKAELDRMKSSSVERSAPNVRVEEADYMIAKLGEDFADVFGDGPSSSLSSRSEHYKARASVVSEMQRIREAAKGAKKRVPDANEAFDQAVRSVFGGKVKQVEQRQLASKVKQRESQLIARPTNNGKRPVSGREKAIANVASMMRDRMSGS